MIQDMEKRSDLVNKPSIRKIDKNLDKYLEKGLFKEKVEKANETLKTVGLPEKVK